MPWGAPPPNPRRVAPQAPGAAAEAAKPSAAPAKKKPPPEGAYRVATGWPERSGELDIILGTYAEQGENHGRKIFQKVEDIPGLPDLKVFLYFWDIRDGAGYSGWWFGDQVGGTQVWARCQSFSVDVPSAGWKVPWDAPVPEPGLLVVSRLGPSPGALGERAPSSTTEESESAAAGCKARADELEGVLRRALADVRGQLDAGSEEGLEASVKALCESEPALADLQRELGAELGRARRGGEACRAAATQMLELVKTVTGLQNSLKELLPQARARLAGGQPAGGEVTKEAADSGAFQQALTSLRAAVAGVREGVDATARLAGRMLDEGPREGEGLSAALAEVEESAKEVQKTIFEVRSRVSGQMQDAKKYGPELHKMAAKELSVLLQQLVEAQATTNLYKMFRKEHAAQAAIRESFAAVLAEFASLEAEAEQRAAAGEAASEAEARAAEEALRPLAWALADRARAAEQRYGTAAAVRDQLAELRERAARATAKVEDTQRAMRDRRERLAAERAIGATEELIARAGEALERCAEAEAPCLRAAAPGPREEREAALQRCDAAAAQAQDAVARASAALLQASLVAGSCADPGLAAANAEAVGRLVETMQSLERRLAEFRAATEERRTAGAVGEVTELVDTAEAKGRAFDEAVASFGDEEALGARSPGELHQAVARCAAAETECASVIHAARQLLSARQQGASAGAAEELAKLGARLAGCQQRAAAARLAVAAAGRVAESKGALEAAVLQMREAEAEVLKVEDTANRAERGELPDSAVLEMVESSRKAQAALRAAARDADAALPSAVVATRPLLMELKERSRRLLGSLNAAAERAREPRERAAAAAFVAEAGRMAEEVAAEMKKVDDAELPFLKGIEGLPLAELQESITLCDTVGESAKVAIAQAQECFRTRLAELGGFKADAARAAKEELTKLAERVTEAAELLTQFWSELEGRRRSARVQEVEEETAGLEADVNKVAEAARPFLTGEAETLAEDAIADGVRTLGELERDAQTRLSAAWLLANRATQDARAFPEMSEALVPVHTKLSALGAELAKARVAASSFDSIVAAKLVNQQVSKVLEEMEAELETARAACAPLLEKGGDEFLVAASVARLGAGLQEHMDEKGLSKEALLEQLSSETLFADFLRALPGASGREDLSFPELRRAAMFRRLDADGDGKLSAQDLVALFRQDYACLREVPVTDSFEVKKATTVAKLRPGDVVEGVGSPRLEASGALRVECRLPAGAGNGFVTVSEGPGAFLKHHTPFDAFCASAEAAVDAATKSMGTLGFQINARLGELPRAAPPGAKGAERRDARLAELRASCTAQAQRAGAAQAGVLALRKALAAERASFARKQAAEDAVHDLARERREAAAVLGPAAERARAVQAALRALRDAAEPLGKAEGEALEASTAPAEVLQEATRLVTALAAAVAAARRALAEEVGRLAGATSGPRLEARETLATYLGDADAADRAGQQVFAMVRSKCAILVDACWSAGGAALRALRDPEQLFEELASSDGRIPEEAFCKQLGSLEDAPVRPEHARLLCSWLGQGGVSRFAFLKFAQRFYRVRKDSVLSEELHIGSSRMVRRLEVDELLLQLGASATDEKAGVERIHARALRDGAMGWVTLTGNKGSPYLEEAEKPAYLCTADMLLDADGGDAGPKVTRTLRAGEVVELLDGPREPGLRCRGRPLGGGAVGWFTLGAATAPWKPVYRCLRATPLLKQAAAEEAEPIRSLAEGETLELLDGPRACEGGAVRMLGRALRDGAVGWAAVREAGGLKALASLAERSAASSCMASSKAASLASLEVPLAAFSKAPAEGPPAAFSKATAEGPPAAFSRGPAEGPPTLSKAAAVEGPPTLSKAAAAEGPPAAFCKAAPDRPAFSKAGLAAPPAGPRPG